MPEILLNKLVKKKKKYLLVCKIYLSVVNSTCPAKFAQQYHSENFFSFQLYQLQKIMLNVLTI